MSPDRRVSAGLPLVVDFAGRRCLCIGGGSVAARRVPAMVNARGVVTIISPDLHPSLAPLVTTGTVRHERRQFQSGDAGDAFFTLAATDDPAVNLTVSGEVLARNGLVCVAHDSSLGNCSFMSTSRRGPVQIALHTGGASPLVAAALRTRIDAALPVAMESVIEELASLRAELKSAVDDPVERHERWQSAARAGLIDRALFIDPSPAIAEIRRLLGLDEDGPESVPAHD